MIASLRGRLAQVMPDSVVVDVGGVGYQVFVPAKPGRRPALGEEVTLYTHLHVKEDDLQLYGFVDGRQRQVFRLLIEVTGIGPKGALGILSAISGEQLIQAILSENTGLLTKLPGVGKKTAQRLVVELKDKLLKEQVVSADTGTEMALPGIDGAVGDALGALAALGYTPQETADWLARATQELGNTAQAADLIRYALKQIGASKN
ncbi:hypothetical protein SY88_19475 [Clostridiales bacterium PH28_bin88]|nr:hypothetical protein SY88_19475 [Clostridiales bacterium PH28_bin88]